MSRNSTSFERGHKPMGGRPKGSLNRKTIEVREFARGLIEDPEYQSSLRRRVIEGKAPQMEMLLFKYAYGQPVERHEVNAEVRAASHSRSALSVSEAAGEARSGTDVIIDGLVVTQDGSERIRGIMEGLIPIIQAGKKAMAVGQLPPSVTTPPGPPA
jgi:hypothetical protein